MIVLVVSKVTNQFEWFVFFYRMKNKSKLIPSWLYLLVNSWLMPSFYPKVVFQCFNFCYAWNITSYIFQISNINLKLHLVFYNVLKRGLLVLYTNKHYISGDKNYFYCQFLFKLIWWSNLSVLEVLSSDYKGGKHK